MAATVVGTSGGARDALCGPRKDPLRFETVARSTYSNNSYMEAVVPSRWVGTDSRFHGVATERQNSPRAKKRVVK